MRGKDEETRRVWYYLGPPVYGAAALFLIVAIRAIGLVLSPHQSLRMWGEALLALAVATAAGFVGGVGYVVLGRPARRVPYFGPYLAGIVTVAAYMGAVGAAFFLIEGKSMIEDRTDAWIFAVLTIFFGLAAGYALRDRAPAQITRDERVEAALKPMYPFVLGLVGVVMLALRSGVSEEAFYAVAILGIVALVGAWIYLKRRALRAPDPSALYPWDRVLSTSTPTTKDRGGGEHRPDAG